MRDGLTLLVADGDAARRTLTCRALAARGFAVLADAGDVATAVAAAVREAPEVCLVDLELPGNGLVAVAQIATRVPAATIVALAGVESPAQMIEALERGASGYLLRDLGDDELARTLRAAHAGEPAIARALVPHLIEHMRGGSRRVLELPGRTVALTPREWEIAGLVQSGFPTDEIAVRLGLSPVTVRRHISAVARKAGTSGRDELVEALERLGR